VLLVFDGSHKTNNDELKIYNQLIKQYQHKIITIINKTDLPQKNKNVQLKDAINISSKTKKNIDLIENAIQEKITDLFQSIESPFLLNQRQFNLLLGLEKKIINIQTMLKNDKQYELISLHFTDALTHITELTGKTISESGMDAVFREFCVGK